MDYNALLTDTFSSTIVKGISFTEPIPGTRESATGEAILDLRLREASPVGLRFEIKRRTADGSQVHEL